MLHFYRISSWSLAGFWLSDNILLFTRKETIMFLWGMRSNLAGSLRNLVYILLSIWLHDGLQAAGGWKGAFVSGASHIVQMVEDAYHAALTFGNSLLLLARYFLTVPALEKLWALNDGGAVRMEIVTKAKIRYQDIETKSSVMVSVSSANAHYIVIKTIYSGNKIFQILTQIQYIAIIINI